jgi:hypothetical protein
MRRAAPLGFTRQPGANPAAAEVVCLSNLSVDRAGV